MSFDHVLLCIRGTLNDRTTEAARETHNATAGNPEGVAAARALGDLSHKVFTPVEGSGAAPDEFLILDVWQTPEAIQKFFSSPDVGKGGAKLFKTRDPVVFMPAKNALSFTIAAPMNQSQRFVAVLRAKVKSPDAALEAFRAAVGKHLNPARQRGQLSHELYFRLDGPAADGTVELLGVDVWTNLEGMRTHYAELMPGLSATFAAPPVTSVWQQPAGAWVEW